MYRFLLLLLLSPLAVGDERLSDPTMPPEYLPIIITEDGVDTTVVADFKLNGITLSPDGGSAIVNGRRVQMDDEIDGGKVVAIEAGMVSIQTATEMVELKLIPMQIKKPVSSGSAQ